MTEGSGPEAGPARTSRLARARRWVVAAVERALDSRPPYPAGRYPTVGLHHFGGGDWTGPSVREAARLARATGLSPVEILHMPQDEYEALLAATAHREPREAVGPSCPRCGAAGKDVCVLWEPMETWDSRSLACHRCDNRWTEAP